MVIISIEGNIGAGKSTLIEQLKTCTRQDVIFVDEPVDEWSSVVDSSGTSILEKYYADQKRYAFAFQMMAFITRVKRLREATLHKNVIIITERSVFTDREIFAKMLHDDGKIEDIEYTIYLKWFDELVGDIQIDGIIYIKTTPEICADHVITRNRPGESIPLEYLRECHQYHEQWMIKEKNVLINPVDTEAVFEWINTNFH